MSTANTVTIVRSKQTHDWECTMCGPEHVDMTLRDGDLVIFCDYCDSEITAR